jgi:aldehyde dehydrogenase
MQTTEDLIRSVVQQVLSQMGGVAVSPPTNGMAARAGAGSTLGVYPTADAAVAAAVG